MAIALIIYVMYNEIEKKLTLFIVNKFILSLFLRHADLGLLNIATQPWEKSSLKKS